MKCPYNVFNHCHNRNSLCIICVDQNKFLQRSNTITVAIKRTQLEELENIKTKWEDPQIQADLELAAAVKLAFENKREVDFVGEFEILEVCSLSALVDWYREQKRGETNG